MRRYIIFICFLSLFFSQKKNEIFYEYRGNGINYSVNYQRSITDRISGRIGFSSIPISGDLIEFRESGEFIMVQPTYWIGSDYKLELGIAALIRVSETIPRQESVLLNGRIAYVFTNPEDVLSLKASITPQFNSEDKVLVGLAIGIKF